MPKNGNKQNKRGRVTVPMQARMGMAPLMNTQSIRRPVKEKVYRECGSDFIGGLVVKGSDGLNSAADRILSTINVEPAAFPGTRLSVMAGLYERYRFRKFNLRYVPAVPNTLACQILWYFDTDPRDDPTSITDDAALIRQALAHTGGQQWNFNKPHVNPLPQRVDDQWYYTSENSGDQVRFTRQAVGRMIQVTSLVDFNGSAPTGDIEAGSLYIDWECEFQLPQIDADVVTRSLGSGGAPSLGAEFLQNTFVGVNTVLGAEVLDSGVQTKDTLYAITDIGYGSTAPITSTYELVVDAVEAGNPSNVLFKYTYTTNGPDNLTSGPLAIVPAGFNVVVRAYSSTAVASSPTVTVNFAKVTIG